MGSGAGAGASAGACSGAGAGAGACAGSDDPVSGSSRIIILFLRLDLQQQLEQKTHLKKFRMRVFMDDVWEVWDECGWGVVSDDDVGRGVVLAEAEACAGEDTDAESSD